MEAHRIDAGWCLFESAHRQSHSPPGRDGLTRVNRIDCDVVDLTCHRVYFIVGVSTGQSQQFIDQPGDPVNFRSHPAQCLMLRRRFPWIQRRQIDIAWYSRHGGTQLVRGIREKPALSCEDAVHLIEQCIEAEARAAEFIR
jgi:hypothetical protein